MAFTGFAVEELPLWLAGLGWATTRSMNASMRAASVIATSTPRSSLHAPPLGAGRLLAIVVGLAATELGCGDDDGGRPDAAVDSAVPVDLGPRTEARFDTLNVGLAGAFVPNEAARREPVYAAVAGMDSDVVCLQEVWTQSDKDAVIAAAAATFPHVLSFTHDRNTPVTDPTDVAGATPPAFTTAPCEGEMLEAMLDSGVACVAENCSTIPGSDEGMTTSTSCAAESCAESIVPLLTGGAEELRCYGCIASNLPTESLRDIRTACTTETNSDLAFRGQSGVMILSKHPLSETQDFVLPGTWNRRIVAAATVTLPDPSGDKRVDVYCNHLTPIFGGLTFPYTGLYGEGRRGAQAWAAEQRLQAEKLVSLVQTRSGDRPAVIMGDFNAGKEYEGTELQSEGPDTVAVLESAFTLALGPGVTPQCTFCPDNGNLAEDTDTVWIDLIYMANMDAASVVSSSRTFDEATVTLEDGSMVPISDHYGYTAVIAVP